MRKKLIKLFSIISSIFIATTLCSCGEEDPFENMDPIDPDALLSETPVTDSCKLDVDYAGKVFTRDHIGKVTLRSNTDGDTAKFYDTNSTTEFFPVRFLGINTPESTGSIEPWGKKASLFTASKLDNAKDIILINDVDVFNERDSSGNRYLAFIWYRNDTNSDFRLLNLEIVEQGYSKNFLYDESTICPYITYFQKAEENAKKVKVIENNKVGYKEGLRVQGSKDPGYDYSKKVYITSIRTLLNNYEEWGVTDESSGKRLKMTCTVVGASGNNLYLRDVVADVENNPNEELGYVYLFSGYTASTSSACSIGDFISFYCRATKFLDVIQLSDLSFSSYGKEPFVNLTRQAATNEEIREAISDYIPFNKDTDYNNLNNCNTMEDVSKYANTLCEGLLTIRYVNNSTDDDIDEGTGEGENYYFKKDANDNMTVYSILNCDNTDSPLYINMRIEGGTYPYPRETMFAVGNTYKVKGFLKPYYEKYQFCLFNNDLTIDTYIQEVM